MIFLMFLVIFPRFLVIFPRLLVIFTRFLVIFLSLKRRTKGDVIGCDRIRGDFSKEDL